MKNVWVEILEVCNEETGECEQWAREVNHEIFGKYIWITKEDEKCYVIEYDEIETDSFKKLFTAKSLKSAKAWVSRNIC